MTGRYGAREAPLLADAGQELPDSATLHSGIDGVYAITAAVEAHYDRWGDRDCRAR